MTDSLDDLCALHGVPVPGDWLQLSDALPVVDPPAHVRRVA